MPTEIDLGFTPRKWQADVLRNRKRFNCLLVHRRGGKTFVCNALLFHAALTCTRPNPRYLYLAPFLKQAKDIAWTYLKTMARKIPGADIKEAELKVILPNGAQIALGGANNPESLPGQYLDGLVMDEAAAIDPRIYYEYLGPTLIDRQGWVFVIGTPRGLGNLFAEIYHTAIRDAEWNCATYDVTQTQALPEEEVERIRQQYYARNRHAAFEQEFMCSWTAQNEAALLNPAEIRKAVNRGVLLTDVMYNAKIIGCDVARFGDDATVVARRQGLLAFPLVVLQKYNTLQIADYISQIRGEWVPDGINVDGTGGFGAGVVDNLRRLMNINVFEVHFAASPEDSHLLNKRAEMYQRLADWIRGGGQIPNDPDLIAELSAIEYEIDNAGRMKILSKSDIKEKLGRSPDRADALALTFASNIQPAGFVNRACRQQNATYDVMGMDMDRPVIRPALPWGQMRIGLDRVDL